MEKKVVSTGNAPAAIGPYNQAIIAGNMVYCSGQIPLDPANNDELIEGDITEQTDRVLRNLKAVLEAAGSGLNKVVKTTVYLTTMDNFAEMNAVYAQYFTENAPARATIAVSELPKYVDVEIDCIAML